MNEPAVSLDHEVIELLAGEPQLLAIADAITATQPRRPARRRRLRLIAVAAAAVLVAGVLAALPQRGSTPSVLAEALAAVGGGPVVHARIEARLPTTNVVELATGREVAQTVSIEYWFDEPRGRLRTLVRRGGITVDEFLQTRAGAAGSQGPVRTLRGAEPALDPALAGFVTRYREALASGEARRLSEGELDGRSVVWLLLAGGETRERVAVDADTFVPVLIVPLDGSGRPSSISWRVRTIESSARVEADFAPPRPTPPRPYRGDVRGSEPLSSAQVRDAFPWPALWLGDSWRGLPLASLERQALTRGYPPGTGIAAERGEGLRLRYGLGGEESYVELSQAPFPEPAYGFLGGTLTFDGNPIPARGSVEIVELVDGAGRATVVGQLRRDGVFVTIWASSRELCLEAARALRRVST